MATYDGTLRGTYKLYETGYDGRLRGTFAMKSQKTGKLRGMYRQPDDDLDLYQYWISKGAAIDFATAPTGTSATLPITSAALTLPGAGQTDTYYVAVRKQNAYGMQSSNITAFSFILDENGERVTPLPSAPVNISVTPIDGRYVRVEASYLYLKDAADVRADRFVMYYTDDGSTPVALVDENEIYDFLRSDGVAKLRFDLGPFTEAATVKVLVVMERDLDLIQSDNTDVYTTTASDTGPDAADPHIFTGTKYEEQQ